MTIDSTIIRIKIHMEKRVTSVPESVKRGLEENSGNFLKKLSKFNVHLEVQIFII